MVENSCGQNFIFYIQANAAESDVQPNATESDVTFLGHGDKHDVSFEQNLVVSTEYGVATTILKTKVCITAGIDWMSIHRRNSDAPMIATMFFITVAAFVAFVTRRQKKLLGIATNTSDIVSGPNNNLLLLLQKKQCAG